MMNNAIAAEWPSGQSRIRRESGGWGLHQLERDLLAPTMESRDGDKHPSFNA